MPSAKATVVAIHPTAIAHCLISGYKVYYVIPGTSTGQSHGTFVSLSGTFVTEAEAWESAARRLAAKESNAWK